MPSARYRYRFYPNAEQRQMLARQFGCCRYVYNWALAMKRDAFRERAEMISYAETDKRLTRLKREPDGRYYISFVVEVEPEPLPRTKKAVGIDLGLNDVVVTSDGWHGGNPKHLKRAQDRLALEQKRLSRKQKGSANWHKQRRKVARLQAKVRNQRQDFLHQLSTRLVRRYDVICTESLNVKGMMGNHCLAQAISDVGWGSLVGMLQYKAEWYGKAFVQIDRFYPSSKTCSECGHTLETLPLNVRRWQCPACEAEHQRDVNAAKNIKAVGHTVLASGLDVRPALALVSGAVEDEGRIPRLPRACRRGFSRGSVKEQT